MSWIRMAFGLIREVASTEEGQEVLKNVRSHVFRGAPGAADPPEAAGTPEANPDPVAEVRAWLAEHRAEVDRNLDNVVRAINEHDQRIQQQDRRFLDTIRTLRNWNLALSAGLVVAIVLAVIALVRG